MSSDRTVPVDGVSAMVDEAAAAGFSVDRRSTILLALALGVGAVSPDMEWKWQRYGLNLEIG